MTTSEPRLPFPVIPTCRSFVVGMVLPSLPTVDFEVQHRPGYPLTPIMLVFMGWTVLVGPSLMDQVTMRLLLHGSAGHASAQDAWDWSFCPPRPAVIVSPWCQSLQVLLLFPHPWAGALCLCPSLLLWLGVVTPHPSLLDVPISVVFIVGGSNVTGVEAG